MRLQAPGCGTPRRAANVIGMSLKIKIQSKTLISRARRNIKLSKDYLRALNAPIYEGANRLRTLFVFPVITYPDRSDLREDGSP